MQDLHIELRLAERTIPLSLAAGELRRGLAEGDPRERIAQPALLVGSVGDPTFAEAEQVRAPRD
jgi:hypothetical protein